jgi:2-dehydropantoate 2-reductase
MRIAVMGSGAVGGYFGAKLAAAGHDLAFIARGKHLDEMKANGLRVKSPNGDLHIHHAKFTGETQQVGKVDLILFCVKSYDTDFAAEMVRPMVSDQTTLLSLQNGIDNPEKLARIHGDRQVLPAVVYVGAQLTAPGVIAHSNGGRIIFGQMDGGASETSKVIQRTFVEAGIPCEISTEIQKMQWTKLLWNVPFCAISCLTRANMKEIVESESLTQLALDCMAEVRAAARTKGIDLPRKLFDDVLTFSRSLGEFKPSMLQDLEANKPLEYEAFNGVVVRLLQAAGQPAVTNQIFFGALKFLDKRIREEARS